MSNHFRYATAPDGTLGLRESENREYTHAIAVKRDGGWGIPSFSGTRHGAESLAASYAKRGYEVAVVETVAVTAAEFRQIKKTGSVPASVGTSAVLDNIDETLAALAVEDTNHTMTQEVRKMNKSTSARTCNCGCGEVVNGKSSYRQGHDARHVSTLTRRVALREVTLGEAQAALLGRPNLQAKLEAAVARALAPKSSKPRKAKANDDTSGGTDATVAEASIRAKVGRWEYEGILTPLGRFVYTNSKGETIMTDRFTQVGV